MRLRKVLSTIAVVGMALMVASCTDAYEERGLCSYLGTCTMGMGEHTDINYCKQMGSCSDDKDPTEYTISGKHTSKSSSDDGGSE